MINNLHKNVNKNYILGKKDMRNVILSYIDDIQENIESYEGIDPLEILKNKIEEEHGTYENPLKTDTTIDIYENDFELHADAILAYKLSNYIYKGEIAEWKKTNLTKSFKNIREKIDRLIQLSSID